MKQVYVSPYIAIICGLIFFGFVAVCGCLFAVQTTDRVIKEEQNISNVVSLPDTPTVPAASETSDILDKSPGKPPLSGFSITDKLSYEEEKRLVQNFSPHGTISDSGMTRVIFQRSWFVQHDEDPQQDTVRLTFPVSWLDTSPVDVNETIVVLNVPERMLELDDTNPDPMIITVSYPKSMFSEFSNIRAINLSSKS